MRIRRLASIATLLVTLFVVVDAATGAPHYQMHVAVDYDAGAYDGGMRLEYTNRTGASLGELFFRLYPNATGIYGDATLRVTETLVDGQVVETTMYVDDTVLYVPLPDSLAPDASVSVALTFEGSADDWTGATPPDEDAYGLLTRSDHAMTMTAFYPILAIYSDEGWGLDPVLPFGDALMSAAASYDVTVTVPDGIEPVASGVRTEQSAADGTVTHRFTVDGARDFSLVLLDGYDQQTGGTDDVAMHAWFTPQRSRAGSIALRVAQDATVLYTARVGPMRYREVDLVEVPLQVAAGVEFSGLILIGSAYAERPLETFYAIIVSHEMAHQWFYAGVGNDPSEHPWLDESFATYFSYLSLDAFYGSRVADTTLRQWEQSYEQARRNGPDVSVGSPLYAFSGSATYSGYVYSGGALFLHAVREVLGDEAFFAALASYYERHLGRIVSPKDLIDSLETGCACDLTEVLDAYGLGR